MFQAASFLLNSDIMCPYEQEWLEEVWVWFRYNLSAPDIYKQTRIDYNVICWFKHTANEHLQKMYEMSVIPGQYGLNVSQVKSCKPGYIIYEDEDQIAVLPFADSRKLVR